MKRIFFSLIICSGLVANDNLILIDTIEAVIYGQEGTELVTLSDVSRPPLGGEALRPPEDHIFERLIVLDAKKIHAMPTEEETEKTINTICRENNLTKEQFDNVARSGGYTPEGAREQFRNMHAANKMLDYKVRSHLIVPKKEVEQYCQEHPEWTVPEYQLEYAFVPFSVRKKIEDQEKDLTAYAQGKKDLQDISWSEPFWVSKPDISQDHIFITELKPNDIKVHQTDKGFELYKLDEFKDAREKTAEERYFEVADILRRPRGEQLMEEYKKSLYESTSILYLDKNIVREKN